MTRYSSISDSLCPRVDPRWQDDLKLRHLPHRHRNRISAFQQYQRTYVTMAAGCSTTRQLDDAQSQHVLERLEGKWIRSIAVEKKQTRLCIWAMETELPVMMLDSIILTCWTNNEIRSSTSQIVPMPWKWFVYRDVMSLVVNPNPKASTAVFRVHVCSKRSTISFDGRKMGQIIIYNIIYNWSLSL